MNRVPKMSSPPAPVPEPRGPALAAWCVALFAAVSPLWLTRALPLVDLPQHLYVLEVLHRLHDPSTLFPQTFEFHARWSPYVGYYLIVGALHALLPLELSNRLFLTATVAGLPLAMAFLLRSLRRPAWPALLAVPFAYGDCFAWGFVNTCAAMPFALLAAGAAVRSVSDASARTRWVMLLVASTLAGFAMHPAPTGFLVFAVPLLLLTTAAPEDRADAGLGARLRGRIPALVGLMPVVLAALAWAVPFASAPIGQQPGVQHFAWGPMLSRENLGYETAAANLRAFPWLLGNILNDGTDQIGVLAVFVLALLACVARLFESAPARLEPEPVRERARPLALVAIAFGLFMLLPLDIRGYIYYLSPRFAPLTATLAAALVPRQGPRSMRWLTVAATVAAVLTALPLAAGFRAFDREAAPLRTLSAAMGERPRLLALMFDPRSRVIHHPVFLHAGVSLAGEHGGLPNYTLAGGEQIPLRYRSSPPANLPSEWEPEKFDYARLGPAYDHFLLRGASPDSVFGARLGGELRVAAHAGDWWLVRRALAASPPPAPAATPR